MIFLNNGFKAHNKMMCMSLILIVFYNYKHCFSLLLNAIPKKRVKKNKMNLILMKKCSKFKKISVEVKNVVKNLIFCKKNIY